MCLRNSPDYIESYLIEMSGHGSSLYDIFYVLLGSFS